MALKFKKGTGKKVAKRKVISPKKLTGDLTVIIDDGSLDKAADLVKKIKVAKDAMEVLNASLTKELDSILDQVVDVDKNRKIIIEGNENTLKLGAKGKSTVVTAKLENIHELLGDEVFYAVANVGITNLKKYLTPEELTTVSEIVQEGARSKKFLDKV